MHDDRLASAVSELLVAAAVVPHPLPMRIGERDRYELQELIAVSDRSHVYRGEDLLFSEDERRATVIVKIMSAGTRGEREAKSARHIDSPYVVRVLDRGMVSPGEHFSVMEHVRGGDLSEQKVPWPPGKAAAFMAQLAAAVQSAHSCGVVHCDLKPGNVLVTENGEPRLTDFDLSTGVVDGPESGSRGNRAFSAPEQWAGEPGAMSPRADVYALGGLLAYLLSGRMPNGDTAREISQLHAGERQRSPLEGPAALVAIANRALALNPKDRYQTAEQFGADLLAWIERRPLPSQRASATTVMGMWCRRHPAKAASAAGGLSLAIAIAGFSWKVHSTRQSEALRIAQEATAMSQRQLAAFNDRAAGQLESMAYTLRVMSINGSPEQISGALVMLQQLEAMRFDLGTDVTSTGPLQAGLLEEWITKGVDAGRSEHFDTQAARLMLSLIRLREGQLEEASKVAEETRALWGERLAPGELLDLTQRFACEMPRAIIELRDRGNLAPGTRQSLESLRAEFIASGRRSGMVKFADRVLKGQIPPVNSSR